MVLECGACDVVASEYDLPEALELRANGASYAVSGRHFGVGAETVRRRLLQR